MLVSILIIIAIIVAFVCALTYNLRNGACGTCSLASSCTKKQCSTGKRKMSKEQKDEIDALMEKHHVKASR